MKFLVFFVHETPSFRLGELHSLCEYFNISLSYDHASYSEACPFLYINIPSECDAHRILSRAILIKSMTLAYTEAVDYPTLFRNLTESQIDLEICRELKAVSNNRLPSFKFDICSFARKLTKQDQLDRMHAIISRLPSLSVESSVVNLNTPDIIFSVIEDYSKSLDNPQIHFGKVIGDSHRYPTVDIYDLKKRAYVGTTSMNAEFALLMANMAHAGPNNFFLDPFVGTGSVIIACAHFKAQTFGFDIDPRAVRGIGRGADGLYQKGLEKGLLSFLQKEESAGDADSPTTRHPNNMGHSSHHPRLDIFSNFQQYHLVSYLPQIVLLDITRRQHLGIRLNSFFDGIVTDPPYGLRAGARQLGRKNEEDEMKPIPEDLRANHITPWKPYPIENVIRDLLDLSVTSLKRNKRLVYWLPVWDDDISDEKLTANTANSHQKRKDKKKTRKIYSLTNCPQHPCLKALYIAEQDFGQWSRWLITMEKTRDYVSDDERQCYLNEFASKYYQGPTEVE